MRHHAHHRAVHLGRRVERFGRHEQHIRHVIAPLQHDRQAAICRRGWCGDHAVDHLLLKHEMLVLHHIDGIEQMEQNRRGDVVGQIANNSQLDSRQTLCQKRKINIQHIGLDDRQIRPSAQAAGQVTVELDYRQPPQPLDQRLRQRGQAGADFDHGLARTGIDGIDNGIDDAVVTQKMLTKPLASNVLHWGGSRIST